MTGFSTRRLQACHERGGAPLPEQVLARVLQEALASALR